nr:sigma factor [Streptomyces sp. SID337]
MEGGRVVDEGAVTARVRAGEPEAYAEWVRAFTGIALRAAVALGAGSEAEDVVQQAFFKAYCSLGRFRDGAAFEPWLLTIVANETRNTVRSAVRQRSVGPGEERGGAGGNRCGRRRRAREFRHGLVVGDTGCGSRRGGRAVVAGPGGRALGGGVGVATAASRAGPPAGAAGPVIVGRASRRRRSRTARPAGSGGWCGGRRGG